MNRWVIALCIALTANTAASAQSVCEAQAIEALRSTSTSQTRSETSSLLYEMACSEKISGSSTNASGERTGYFQGSFSTAKSSTARACAEKDIAYFSRNSADIATSFLPREAFEILGRCQGGLQLRATSQSGILTISSTYVPKDNNDPAAATVRSLSILPAGVAQCEAGLGSEDKIGPGSTIVLCTLTDPRKDVTIALTTDAGAMRAFVPGVPEISYARFDWSYRVGRPTNLTQCRNQGGNVGSFNDCRADGTCNNQLAITGLCLARNGRGMLTVGDTEYLQADVWDYAIKGGPNTGWYICSLNGEDIGNAHDCHADKTCGSVSAIVGTCAGRYGLSRP